MMRIRFNGAILDLERAITRTEMDMFDDWHPDVLAREGLRSVGNLLDRVRDYLHHGGFAKAEQFDIPKPGFTLRYGLETDVAERLLYQALTDTLIVDLDQALDASILGYRLSSASSRHMFTPRVSAWVRWTALIRESLEEHGEVLLRTDINNYFESLKIDRLCDSLVTMKRGRRGAVKACCDMLKTMLTSWTPFDGRGIPQNRDPSSFLGNVFLATLDREMQAKGYMYFRWVDDMMVVCRDKYEARAALKDIITCLRRLGLNVNTQKTKIVDKSDREAINEHLPVADRQMEQIDELLRPGSLPPMRRAIPLLRRLLARSLSDLDSNERGFRFCLHRINALQRTKGIAFRDDDLTDQVIDQLSQRPWWSDAISHYLRLVPLLPRHIEKLSCFLSDDRRHIYGWQGYHLWTVLGSQETVGHDQIRLARSRVRAAASPAEVAASAVFLGRHGTSRDRKQIATRLGGTTSRFVRRAFAIASQQVSAADADRYVRPNLDRSVVAMYDELRQREAGPLYYAALEAVDADDVFNLLPGEGIS
jgi:hypothetical protein